jgi:hypothetical protein
LFKILIHRCTSSAQVEANAFVPSIHLSGLKECEVRHTDVRFKAFAGPFVCAAADWNQVPLSGLVSNNTRESPDGTLAKT